MEPHSAGSHRTNNSVQQTLGHSIYHWQSRVQRLEKLIPSCLGCDCIRVCYWPGRELLQVCRVGLWLWPIDSESWSCCGQPRPIADVIAKATCNQQSTRWAAQKIILVSRPGRGWSNSFGNALPHRGWEADTQICTGPGCTGPGLRSPEQASTASSELSTRGPE